MSSRETLSLHITGSQSSQQLDPLTWRVFEMVQPQLRGRKHRGERLQRQQGGDLDFNLHPSSGHHQGLQPDDIKQGIDLDQRMVGTPKIHKLRKPPRLKIQSQASSHEIAERQVQVSGRQALVLRPLLVHRVHVNHQAEQMGGG